MRSEGQRRHPDCIPQSACSVAGRKQSILETLRSRRVPCSRSGIFESDHGACLMQSRLQRVRTIMSEMGMALMGAASAAARIATVEAAKKEISSPACSRTLDQARVVCLNIKRRPDLGLQEGTRRRPYSGGSRRRGQHHLRRVIDERCRIQNPHHRHRDLAREPREEEKRPQHSSTTNSRDPRVGLERERESLARDPG